ncbi:MAG: hypothetical protein WB383_07890, partial [Acidimicrobiales bacterium]
PTPAPVAPAVPTDPESPNAPSRDDLVTAWADDVLQKLRPKVRAIYQAGRFVGTEGPDAILCLPNDAHIAHAEPLRAEVAEALSRHFGRPVGLRLVAEAAAPVSAPAGSAPRRGRRPPTTVESAAPEEDLLDELVEDADPARAPEARPPSSAEAIEGRLLEAFPGAEEM